MRWVVYVRDVWYMSVHDVYVHICSCRGQRRALLLSYSSAHSALRQGLSLNRSFIHISVRLLACELL